MAEVDYWLWELDRVVKILDERFQVGQCSLFVNRNERENRWFPQREDDPDVLPIKYCV